MALVSSLWRQVPSTWAGGLDERRVRMKRALQRVQALYGAEQVAHRLRAYMPANEDERVLQQVLLAEVGG